MDSFLWQSFFVVDPVFKSQVAVYLSYYCIYLSGLLATLMLIQSLRQNKLEASIWTSNPISETKLEPFALQQRRTAVLFCQLLSLFVRALEKENRSLSSLHQRRNLTLFWKNENFKNIIFANQCFISDFIDSYERQLR